MFHAMMMPTQVSRFWWQVSTQAMVQQLRCAQVMMAATMLPQARMFSSVAAPINVCGVGFGPRRSRPANDPAPLRVASSPAVEDAREPTLPEEELGLRARRRRQPATPPAMPAARQAAH